MSAPAPLPAILTEWLEQRWPPADDDARRLFHGRGNCFPGLEQLTVDWYPPLLLLTCYREPETGLVERLLAFLDRLAPGAIEAAMLQRRDTRPPRWQLLRGELPQRPTALEAGLRYPLLLNQGINHGFFLDMRCGRQVLRETAAGKRVLNLFAYTCALSVAALAGGASEVINLDMSKPSLAIGRRAHQLNNLDLRRVSFLPHDLFKSFGKLEKLGPFDLVLIDPPADQGRSFNARRDWPKLLARLPGLLTADGEAWACVSAPELGREFLQQQFREQLPDAHLLQTLTAGDDFPERDRDKGLQLLRYRLADKD